METVRNSPVTPDTDVVRAAIDTSPRRRWLRPLIWTLVVLLGLTGVGAGYALLARPGDTTAYRTEPVQRGALTVNVTATGQVQPLNQVDVGSELSGRLASVDVDYNDTVTAGQVLARLDTDELEATVREQRAALDAARASVSEAQATQVEARLKYARNRDLAKRELASREDVDTAEAAFKRAEAGVVSARADVSRAEATLRTAETRLDKAVIRAPISGIVLARNVEPGQTVVASLQTPVLFTLAENLEHMELHVDVDEADVGRLKAGETATFTVDAYPDRTFPAHVTQVRYAPRTVEGVVTYETLLEVDNAELLLRPGMTATAEITVATVDDALLVPNTALRYQPVQAPEESARGGGVLGMLFPHRPSRERRPATDKAAPGTGRVWVLGKDGPQAVEVETGLTDGRLTALHGDSLTAGTRVIVGQETPS